MQVPGATVIAEPGPRGEHVGLAGARERGDGGIACDEALIEWECGRHAGLLEHDLGDPDAVGIANPPPRQIPVAPAVPVEQWLAPRALGAGSRGPSRSPRDRKEVTRHGSS